MASYPCLTMLSWLCDVELATIIAVYRLPCIAKANFSNPCKYSSLLIKSLFLLFATQETEDKALVSIDLSKPLICLFFKFSIFVPGNCPCIALTNVEYDV